MTDLQEDRLSWVRGNQALVERLNALWPAWEEAGQDGLTAILDTAPE